MGPVESGGYHGSAETICNSLALPGKWWEIWARRRAYSVPIRRGLCEPSGEQGQSALVTWSA